MFESMAGDGAAGDETVAPAPAALAAAAELSADPPPSPSSPCWAEAAPGPQLIAALAEVSLQACTDEQLLDVLAGWERAAAWLDAQRLRALARTETRLLETAARHDNDLNGTISWTAVHRQTETEIATALHWTAWQTQPRLRLARDLTDRLPRLLDAMSTGQLSYRHAELITEETDTLTDPQARHLLTQLLPAASRHNTIWLRRQLRRACLQLDPDSANERAAQAVTERSVTIRPLPDGLAQLHAIGPAEAILAMFRALDDTADHHPKEDPRTQTARRFDTLVDLVLTGSYPPTNPTVGREPASPTGPEHDTAETASDHTGESAGFANFTDFAGVTGVAGFAGEAATGDAAGCPPQPKIPVLVQLTMDLPTLLGLRNNPAELHGYGPLPAALARALATHPGSHWQRFVHDPITGAPHDLGRTRRHPDTALRRWIITRDRTCLFPHCYRPAHTCEPDHNPAWKHGGRTDKDTLHSLCPKHHKVRHHGWNYTRHPDRLTWTSPHQQTYERYFTEADLIGPDNTHPHHDHTYNDTICPPLHDDQRLDIFLTPHPGQPTDPTDEIPPHIIETFRLDDPDTFPTTTTTTDEEAALDPDDEYWTLYTEDRRNYGDDLTPTNTIIGRARLNKARHQQTTRQPPPDDPPF